jgi:hypothetical protein
MLDISGFNPDIEEYRSRRLVIDIMYRFALGFASRPPQNPVQNQNSLSQSSLNTSISVSRSYGSLDTSESNRFVSLYWCQLLSNNFNLVKAVSAPTVYRRTIFGS